MITEKAGTASSASKPFPRTAKGRRPYFFDDSNVDKLLAMVMALAGEVSVLRDRLDTHEKLAAGQKWASEKNIEAYEPSQDVLAERAERRNAYVSRILRIVNDEAEGASADQADREYDQLIDELSE
jgi:hypothetical protein